MSSISKFLTALTFAFLLSVWQASAATTEWQDLGGGKARLAAVLDPNTNEVEAIVEIKLDPGWKTYWREPGGSGIPPQFDFSASRHFFPGEVMFPIPQRLEASGIVFPGYSGTVSFPFRGKMAKSGGEGAIRLNLLAGVCEDICIPATVEFEIQFSDLLTSDPASAMQIKEAFGTLPNEAKDDFKIIRAVKAAADRLEIEVKMPDAGPDAALFAEGPYGWYLPPAKYESTENGLTVFSQDITDIPEGADPTGTKLRYTLVHGDRGIEQWVSAEK
ncbi:MAG: protein-disulfide reductase DsbD domain-containing protein [Pseudomonadota bacterium]